MSCALVLLVAACAHHGAGAGRTRTRAAASPAPVPTAVAKSATVDPTLTISGIIAPLQNVAVSSSLSEPTLAVYVNEGDRVHKGQVLAKLDVSDLVASYAAQKQLTASDLAKIAQTKYSAQLSFGQNPDLVKEARASLKSAQEALARDKLDLARYRDLAAAGYIANQQYAQQLTTVRTDESNIRSQQAALDSAIVSDEVNGNSKSGLQVANIQGSIADAESAKAQADQIAVSIARGTIVSPVDGIVVNRNLNPGEYPGSRTNFTIQEISQVYAELNGSSADVFRIHAGAPVNLVAGADSSGRVYHGKIVGVLGQVSPGSTNFTVKAVVDNPGDVLQSGIPVTGTISLGATSGIGIPTTAFLDDTASTVLAIRKGVAQTANVTQIATDGTTSIVRGLAAGTRIVANGQLGITPGQTVNPRPHRSGAPVATGSGAPENAESAAPSASPAP